MKTFIKTIMHGLMFGIGFTAAFVLAAVTLSQDITENGVNQGDLVKYLQNVRDVVNELQADHTTNRTNMTETETLIEELSADHATFVTVVTDLKARLNEARRLSLYGVYGNPTLAIDTNFDVKTTEIVYYTNAGTIKTLADNTNCDTGTAKTITGSLFGAAVLSVASGGTCTVTYASGAGYASEAAAIAALTDPGATETVIGYFTIQAHASGFTAGTDALTTGTGGNVATATTYYNSINPNTLMMGAAVSSSPPATLTAPDPASPAAAISNSTALKLTGG